MSKMSAVHSVLITGNVSKGQQISATAYCSVECVLLNLAAAAAVASHDALIQQAVMMS